MSNPWVIDQLHITIRLVLALFLGGLIGFEREVSSHAAGLRTHILVCVGSALVMLLSMYGFSAFVNEVNVRIDPSRLAAQVISGIGFLGAGTIIFNGRSITGLTTAASLWVVAGIGLAIGAGFYYPAVLACFMVLISLWILNKVEHKYFNGKKIRILKILAIDQPGTLGLITTLLGRQKVDIRKIAMEEQENENKPNHVLITFHVTIPKPSIIETVLEEINQMNGVTGVTLEKSKN
ncbi:MgtC/SapB family protein [Paenibacillus alginolyticus]|uniref:MgtC/SapB family protein n=1 Tax=Paenibacillus alginolyticus TaxID=59839 RepID=A0ABT4GEQ4_9BACL|nr:MgtC/SapB family protein [Paenibacillus alginolyticus]MCY9666593.1 MgtC/SapB family protein [Paenibacillus alginolyticus]MCY9694584.1 MgtC/SapB family protein [Paenibacillus alginolyticus]MEC0148151.1 MgtC/SapB family protein [Paenibacillus alginolyticus]